MTYAFGRKFVGDLQGYKGRCESFPNSNGLASSFLIALVFTANLLRLLKRPATASRMLSSVYSALIISVLFSGDCSSSSVRALGQLEEVNVPPNDYSHEMMLAVGKYPENRRSLRSYKTKQLLQTSQVDPKVFLFPDLGFKMDPKTVQQPFTFQRFSKPPPGFRSVKGPLGILAKRTETSQASDQGKEFELPEMQREPDNEESGAMFPMGRRTSDGKSLLRCDH
ncbi:uncharacterized protein LOC129706552 [Leucoraja erinacea]|uniref:uncharacterized protein LOC129706552 n=1 Tax=Leucoraja erinaceus TaxID=7782 RepID=UPI002456713B|nr:uncharacterized protein LOC129706552 [Leucoraja erinacea]